MKTIRKFQYLTGIILVCGSALFAQEKEEVPSLAILVYCDGGNQDLADKLQPLIEAEASLQWDGRLVERAKIDNLINEMKLTRSGLSDPNTQLQFGKMIPMDCLLTVRVNKESAKTTLSLFPSTTIIHEKEYKERLEPQSLSVNIVTNAIKAYREHERETDKPQISIGSFYGFGLSKQYFHLGNDISVEVRKELVKNKTITLTERLLPSDFLSEFELARSGLTQHIAQNLSAPPSDILLYGEFKAKPEQDLSKPAAELNFKLFIISPTSLCKSRKIEFSCYSDKPEKVVEQALLLIKQSTDEISKNLDNGQKRSFSENEFEEFKKQAFRLMPNPPSEDNYSGNQLGTLEELELPLHMLECAMLFKADDIQTLVCTGTILHGLSRGWRRNISALEEEVLHKAAIDFIERAYFIESNNNTRHSYWNICIYNGKGSPPPDCFHAAQYIWDTRKSEAWEQQDIYWAARRLIELEANIKKKYVFFAEVIHEGNESNFKFFGILFEILLTQAHESRDNLQSKQEYLDALQVLLADDYESIRLTGHLLYMRLYFEGPNENINITKAPIEFAEHFKTALNITIEISKQNKSNELNNYYIEINRFFNTYEKVLNKYNLEDDSDTLRKTFSDLKTQSSYSNSVSTILSMNDLNLLLPQLYEQGKYEQGYKLIIDHFESPVGNNGVSTVKARLIRWLNSFYFAMNGLSPISLNQLNKIEFDDNATGQVLKLITMGNNIFGIRINYVSSSGKCFRLALTDEKANILKQIPSGVCDIAGAGKYIGIATQKNGFHLLDIVSNEIHNFTPGNSGFPNGDIEYIFSFDNSFIIGIEDENTYIYCMEPNTYKIKEIDKKTDLFAQLRQKIGKNKNAKNILGVLNTSSFIKEVNGHVLEWSKSSIPTPSRPNNIKSKQQIVVRNYEEFQPTTFLMPRSNFMDNVLLTYQGIELSYVNDFTLWNNWLIFATANGLYISKIYSNEVNCLISEPDLMFHSLCDFDDLMYIGTNEGFYCIGAEQFLEMVRQVEKTDK
ncbi:MAG: hypothetical protein JW787_14545 [Sedimentisphaerales bacterium]|nr:hypothetical protein [Sedimentisphaerales bacterium]